MGFPSDFDKLKDKEKVAVLEQRIQFQNETIENQKKQIAVSKGENDQLKDQLEKFSNSIQNQTGVIAEQQTTLKDQETTILQQQMTISELQKQLISKQQKLDEITENLAGYDQQARVGTDQLRSEIKSLNRKIEDQQLDFNNKLIEREEALKALREENMALEKKCKQLAESQTTPSIDSGGLQKQVEDLQQSLTVANDTINNLQAEFDKQKQGFQEEIQICNVKIVEYERIIKKEGLASATVSNYISDRDTAAVTLTAIFSRTKSNVMIFLPEIRVLNDFDFDAIRTHARIQLAVPVQQDLQLIDKLKDQPNIEIRDYTGPTWGIIRDNEEMLLAPPAENRIPSGLVMKSDAQIEAFGTVLRSTWTRLKRI